MVEASRQKLLDGRVELDDVLVHETLTKEIEEYKNTPLHVQAAQRMLDRGMVVGDDKVAYWVARGANGPEPRLPDEWDASQVDLEMYWDRRVMSALDGVILAAYPGAHLGDLMFSHRQSSLVAGSTTKRRRAAPKEVVDPTRVMLVRVDVGAADDQESDIPYKLMISKLTEVARAHPGQRRLVLDMWPQEGAGYRTEMTTPFLVSDEAEAPILALTHSPAQRQATLFDP